MLFNTEYVIILSIMKEYPIKPLMCLELVKLLLLEQKGGGLLTFSLSPLLGQITLIM